MAVKDIGAEDLRRLLRDDPDSVEIIDVREAAEFEQVRIRGSRLIPMNEIPGRLGEIDWTKEVVFVCRSGKRSQLTARLASAGGGEVKNLRYGIFECFRDGRGEFLEGSRGEVERYF